MAVETCFAALSSVVGLDVVELWSQGPNGLSLLHAYVNQRSPISSYTDLIASYHKGDCENEVSRTLCKKSMKSSYGFYWQTRRERTVHPDIPLHTALAFNLPRDNINTDVYIVAYSMKYIKFAQAKLDFLFWMAHASCVAAFSEALSESEEDAETSAESSANGTPHVELSHRVSEDFETLGEEGACRATMRPIVVQPKHFHGRSLSAQMPELSATGSEKDGGGGGAEDKVLPPIPPAALQLHREKSVHGRPPPQVRESQAPAGPSASRVVQRTMSPDNDSVARTATPDAASIIDDSSCVSGADLLDRTEHEESHPVDVDVLSKSMREGKAHLRGVFSFNIIELPLRKRLNRQVDLREMTNLEYLTEGSNSHVYTGVWNNQSVIIKILQEAQINNAVAVHEFDVEFELLSRIDHPNIVNVLGGGSVPRPFIVLERLKDLSQLLDLNANDSRPSVFRRRAFSYTELLKLAKNLADALNYLHTQTHEEATIIHRDLKPENLGLAGDGTLKLFDFGLCRCVQKRTNETDTYEMTGYTGSLRYMAPEVVLSRPYNEKVDVFSYAIVVWTIARNKPPFRGFDREMHRNRVVQGGERPKLEKGWPADFSNLLSECWHQDSSKRPSFADVSARLGAMVKATAGGGSGAASGGGGAASQSAATASSTSTGTSSAGFGGFMRKMIGK